MCDYYVSPTKQDFSLNVILLFTVTVTQNAVIFDTTDLLFIFLLNKQDLMMAENGSVITNIQSFLLLSFTPRPCWLPEMEKPI